ncbi:MAG: glycine cleavage system aminomethyltransferase GcvT [Nitrospirota bacterium]|nr:MAG: glycine cleavage system aminomethyltransferase GcvT [Nitrospirota bacterium]
MSTHTPLYDAHVAHGAKLVDFAGWTMPLQYSGVLDEYQAVRHQAGLFDVSHMGRIAISGKGALEFLQLVTTNDVAKLEEHQAQYSMVCNPDGGVKDDVFVYRLEKDNYLLCANASNRTKILEWVIQQHQEFQESVEVQDQSTPMGQLALQGPQGETILREAVGNSYDRLKPRRSLEVRILGTATLVARTGYTGEIGYELYVPADQALPLWDYLIEIGKPYGLKPAGLGARDLLRLDMGYFLYGNELTEDITPLEAGAEWVVAFPKGKFIGASSLQRQQQEGVTRRLIGFELLEKAVPRHGMTIYREGRNIGEVTSGNLSPVLQKGIGMGYVSTEHSQVGTSLQIQVRGRLVPAVVVKPPFYKRGG